MDVFLTSNGVASQTSPMPSASKSDWPWLLTVGQLSAASGTSSPSGDASTIAVAMLVLPSLSVTRTLTVPENVELYV